MDLTPEAHGAAGDPPQRLLTWALPGPPLDVTMAPSTWHWAPEPGRTRPVSASRTRQGPSPRHWPSVCPAGSSQLLPSLLPSSPNMGAARRWARGRHQTWAPSAASSGLWAAAEEASQRGLTVSVGPGPRPGTRKMGRVLTVNKQALAPAESGRRGETQDSGDGRGSWGLSVCAKGTREALGVGSWLSGHGPATGLAQQYFLPLEEPYP